MSCVIVSVIVSARMSLAPTSGDGGASSDIDIFSSCKGIDKGLNFFRIGQMQQIEMVDREGF